MFTFILYIILAIIFGIFATQNTELVTLSFIGATLSNIPLYIILGVTLVIGLMFSWFVNLFSSVGAALTIRGKEHDINDSKKTITQLKKEIHMLNVENAELKGELKVKPKEVIIDKSSSI